MAAISERSHFRVFSSFQPVLRELGIDGDLIFTDPRILPWRRLPDRDNCTLKATLANGQNIHWHIKRYAATRRDRTPASEEIAGIDLLNAAEIPTATVVGWGELADRRSFVILEDLTGYRPADKLVAGGLPFAALSDATADLAARLHARGLHHRDLYLCHFLAPADGAVNATVNPGTERADPMQLRLIDAARVRKLPRFISRARWIVKDVAQFWYSMQKLPVTDAERTAWITRYAQQRGLPSGIGLTHAAIRKARQIARHDANLRLRRPERDVSIAS